MTSASPEGVVADLTDGLGADVVIEAVGVPGAFELCTCLVRAGGHVANVGVHGKPVSLHLEDLSIKNVTITTGLVDTYTTPTLMSMLAAGQLDTGHRPHPVVSATAIATGGGPGTHPSSSSATPTLANE